MNQSRSKAVVKIRCSSFEVFSSFAIQEFPHGDPVPSLVCLLAGIWLDKVSLSRRVSGVLVRQEGCFSGSPSRSFACLLAKALLCVCVEHSFAPSRKPSHPHSLASGVGRSLRPSFVQLRFTDREEESKQASERARESRGHTHTQGNTD